MLTDQQKIEMRNRQATTQVKAAISALLASKDVTEEIGPPRAYFIGSDRNRYEYQVVKFGAEGEENLPLLERAFLNAFRLVPDGTKLVWRTDFQIEWRSKFYGNKQLGFPARAAHWSGYSRFVAIPKDVVPQVEEAAA